MDNKGKYKRGERAYPRKGRGYLIDTLHFEARTQLRNFIVVKKARDYNFSLMPRDA